MPIRETSSGGACEARVLKGWRSEWMRTEKKPSLQFPSFADLVVLARGLNPFPYRTRPLNPSAPMVLSLKAWKSRSLPGLPRTEIPSLHDDRLRKARHRETDGGLSLVDDPHLSAASAGLTPRTANGPHTVATQSICNPPMWAAV